MAAAPVRAAKLAIAADRRRHYRVDLALAGRLLDSDGREYDCRTRDISAGGACLAASAMPAKGDGVLVYLENLGRLSGEVARIDGDGQFAVIFQSSLHKREKIIEQLTWLWNKTLFANEDARRYTRYESSGGITINLEDGGSLHCEVRDFSMVGCSLKTAFTRPPLGAWVRVGQSYGRVARYLEDGFAVDFEARRKD
ncbi:MAG: PilZ domain-containing protein [Hyphomonadaceae bacterium]